MNAIEQHEGPGRPSPNHDETLAQSAPGADALLSEVEGAFSVSSMHASIGLSSIQNGLHDQEASQARTIGIVFTVIGGLAASWSPFLGGHPVAQTLFVVMMIILTVASLYIWRLGGLPKHYDRLKFRAYGAVAGLVIILCHVVSGPLLADCTRYHFGHWLLVGK